MKARVPVPPARPVVSVSKNSRSRGSMSTCAAASWRSDARAENASDHAVGGAGIGRCVSTSRRSEEHTSELQSLMRISYAVFCLKKKKHQEHITIHSTHK